MDLFLKCFINYVIINPFIKVKEMEEILGGYNSSSWFTPPFYERNQIKDFYIFF
jgi:hypothetical protein